MREYIAESPKQGSKRFNSIVKTIYLAHLFYIIYLCVQCTLKRITGLSRNEKMSFKITKMWRHFPIYTWRCDIWLWNLSLPVHYYAIFLCSQRCARKGRGRVYSTLQEIGVKIQSILKKNVWCHFVTKMRTLMVNLYTVVLNWLKRNNEAKEGCSYTV